MSQFFESVHYRDILKLEFTKRRENNSRYSVRAFSRDLEVDPGHMTRLFSGSKGLSRSSAERLVRNLSLSDQERRYFLNLVTISHARDEKKVKIAQLENEHLRSVMKLKILDVNQFQYISDWVHFAVFGLIMMNKGNCNPEKIARALNVPVNHVKESVSRLVDQKVMELSAKGRYVTTDYHLRIESQTNPTEALRRFHKGILYKSVESVSNQSPSERELASAVLSFKTTRMEEAKKAIRDFEASFRERFAHDDDTDTLYAFSMQFFKLADKKDVL